MSDTRTVRLSAWGRPSREDPGRATLALRFLARGEEPDYGRGEMLAAGEITEPSCYVYSSLRGGLFLFSHTPVELRSGDWWTGQPGLTPMEALTEGLIRLIPADVKGRVLDALI